MAAKNKRKLPAQRRRRLSKWEIEFHKKREAREAKMQADWLADHPGKTVEDYETAGSCIATAKAARI